MLVAEVLKSDNTELVEVTYQALAARESAEMLNHLLLSKVSPAGAEKCFLHFNLLNQCSCIILKLKN